MGIRSYFSEGYAFVIPAGLKLFGLIDKQGASVHQPEFEDVQEFHEGLAVACNNGRYGYINSSGDWVIPPTFDHAEFFWHGLARVSWKHGQTATLIRAARRYGETLRPHHPLPAPLLLRSQTFPTQRFCSARAAAEVFAQFLVERIHSITGSRPERNSAHVGSIFRSGTTAESVSAANR